MSIFESPDKGETVYKREISSLDRELVSISEKQQSVREQILELELWHNIRRKAKTNVALNDILNQAIIVYNLIKDETRN